MLQLPEILGLWSLPLGGEVVLLLLLGWVLVCNGAKHGYHYSFEAVATEDEGDAEMQQKATTPNWFPELHWTDRRMMWGMYGLLAAAGCDLIRVLLAQSVFRPGFQMLIGWGADGKPFKELSVYREKNADGTWQTIQKGITGRKRLCLAGVNLVLLVSYEPLVRVLLDAFSLGGFLAAFS